MDASWGPKRGFEGDDGPGISKRFHGSEFVDDSQLSTGWAPLVDNSRPELLAANQTEDLFVEQNLASLSQNGYGFDVSSFTEGAQDSTMTSSNSEAMRSPFLPLPAHICYGLLQDIGVQLKWLPKEFQPETRMLGNGRLYILMRLILRADHGLIQTPDGHSIAVLNKKCFRALLSCTTCQTFSADVWVLSEEWEVKAKEGQCLQSNRRKVVRMNIDLVLFGPRELGEGLARDLGACQMFLQDPQAGSTGFPYENPQSLHLPDMPLEVDDTDFALNAALRSREPVDVEEESEENHSPDPGQLADLITDIDAFFNQLPNHRSIAMASTDTRLLSPLFDHQKVGLDFMIRRETRSSSTESNLWEMKSHSSGDSYYQHLITGAKSKSPDDFLGGILADDMGLGKTLTALAAISASLENAREFGSRGVRRWVDNKNVITRSQATVVVVPSELLLNTWAREIEKHMFPGSIRYIKFHGQDRRQYDNVLGEQDIILTTYGTVMAERRRGNSAIHRIQWYRLILDEAHTIRNYSSKQFKAMNSVSSHIRWCLTGTPIQNSLEDLGSLVQFLGMPLFNEPATFRKYVTKVRIRKGSEKGEFENLRLILSSVCLRRNKSILPSKGYEMDERRPTFTTEEREQYRNLELVCKRAILVGSKRHGGEQTHHHKVMEALLRLRMFCNNGLGQCDPSSLGSLGLHSRPDEVLSFLQQSGEAICAYCSIDILSLGPLDEEDSGCLTRCWRLVCGECTPLYRGEHRKDGSPFTCSLCHAQHDMEGMHGDEIALLPLAERRYPSKVVSLVQDLGEHYLTSKSVVFSFWKKSLDVVGNALAAQNIKYLRVDGDMPTRKRNTTLLDFQNKSTWRVLLMTFSTGAIGLNGLTVADRVHLLEPQWNPAVENQAIGRVLRLDQQRRVTIIRYAMNQSIEGVVQTRQLRKLQLAGGGFISQEEKRELRANQLQHLQECLDSNEQE